jgi:DNA polymerase II small subunit
MVRVFISKENPELFEKADNLVLDQAVGINGTFKKGSIYAKSIVEPGIPQTTAIKKCNEDINVAFIGDLHVGSKLFLEKEFLNFVSWINGEYGSDRHKALAEKTRYLFVVGDLIDGVGIYPGQESELSIKSVYEQYGKVAQLFSKIRNDIKILVIPGNHDALRLAEPQPRLCPEFAKPLYDLVNLTMLTNPGYVRIHKTAEYEGLKVLIYHGFGFDYYFGSVESIRKNGGYRRPDLLMKLLLEKRHLIPSHGCTPFIPDPKEDPMIIKDVPDIFVSGHIHYTCVGNAGNVVLVSASAWQAKTSFQEKLGHEPEPCRVPVFNLKTRKINVLRFG